MAKRVIILLAFCWCFMVQGAQTLLTNVLFRPSNATNIISLTSTNTDLFSAITGTFPIIAIGATTNSQPDSGWSAEVRKVAVTGAFTNIPVWGVVGAWFKYNQFACNSSDQTNTDVFNSSSICLWLNSQSHGRRSQVSVAGAGTVYLWDAVAGSVTGPRINLNEWTYMAMAYHTTNTGTWVETIQLYTMPIGGTLTFRVGITNSSTSSQITGSGIGYNAANANLWSGRISGVNLCSITDFSDVAYPSTIIQPLTNRTTWFVNAAAGSDGYSGLDGGPWQSLYKLTSELRYGGVMGASLGPWIGASTLLPITNSITDDAFIGGVTNLLVTPGGDKVLLDASGGTFYGTNVFLFMPGNQGVEVGSTNGVATIETRKTLTTFTQYDPVTFTNIWSTTNLDARSTLFENGAWMNNPTNTDIVSVRTNLNSTPNSFFNDGTNLYLVATGNGNPNSNGKTYQRSQQMYNKDTLGYGASIALTGSNVFVHDINVYAGPFRNPTNGACDSTYVMQNTSSGRTVVSGVNLWGGGNHAYGATSGDATLKRWLLNSTCQQCAPWLPNATGFDNVVEFADTSVAANKCAYFFNVDFSIQSVIGSALGVSSNGSWYCHSGSSSTGQYDFIKVIAGKGLLGMGEGIVKPNQMTVSQCNLFSLSTGQFMTNPAISQCYIGGFIGGSQGATVTDSIINRVDDITQANTLAGTWNIRNCTFDARNPSVSAPNNSILKCDLAAVMTLNMSNCVFLLPNSNQEITAIRYKTNDVLTLNNNVYLPGPANMIVRFNNNSTNLTLVQWQALGKDAASLSTDPCLSANWRPYAKTPTWTSGVDFGPAIDFTGKTFQSRRTMGAYELQILNAQILLGHR